jgi:hypothetical protein
LPPPTTRAAKITLAFSPVARSVSVVATVKDWISDVVGFFKPPATSVTTSWLAGVQAATTCDMRAVEVSSDAVVFLNVDPDVLPPALHPVNASASIVNPTHRFVIPEPYCPPTLSRHGLLVGL